MDFEDFNEEELSAIKKYIAYIAETMTEQNRLLDELKPRGYKNFLEGSNAVINVMRSDERDINEILEVL